MANIFYGKEIMEKLNISEETKKQIGEDVVLGLSQFFISLFDRVHDLSKWGLAGSLTSTFAILIAIKDLKDFYDGNSIKGFLALQVISILFGIWYLFWREFKNAASKSAPLFMIAMINAIKGVDLKIIEKQGLKHEDLVKELLESYKKRGPEIAWRMFKESFPVFIQIVLLGFGLIVLVWKVLEKL